MSTVEAAAAPAQSPGLEPGPWERWSDRCNPILVREVQQAVKGRLFVLSVLAALAIAVIIAISVASDHRAGMASGRNAFDAGLATLVPLLLFVVPMQAYQSMRLEMRAGIAEQLLLSQLRPWRIVAGKVAAALVQFVLYVSVLAPLLATSYLLRGVDLPTIGVCLGFALVFCLAATAFAISAAAQGTLPALQGLANLGVAAGLGIATFGMMAFVGSGECANELGWLMRSRELLLVVSLIVLGCLAGTALSCLVAQSFLSHAYENRSTPFRVFLFVVMGVAFGWLYVFVDPAVRVNLLGPMQFLLVLLGAAFGVFFVTEQRGLSPRVQAHVPRSGVLALLVAPLLPGRDRGFLCALAYLVLLTAFVWPMWPAPGARSYWFGLWRMGAMTAGYMVVYLSFGRLLRGRLPASVLGNHAARVALPLLLFVACVLPLLFDLLALGGVVRWHLGHCLNPFFTIAEFAWRDGGNNVTFVLLSAAAVLVLLQALPLWRSVREVLAASAARRAREAAGGAGDGR
jgi:hypothetical protein